MNQEKDIQSGKATQITTGGFEPNQPAQPAKIVKLAISSIRVRHRVRQDVGDLTSLKLSLQCVGQLVPLGVIAIKTGDSYEYVLVNGGRRLKAAEELGWTEIDVRVLDTADDLLLLLAERDENVERKELTLSEREAFAQLIAPLEEAAAKARQLGGKASGKLPEGAKGAAKEKIAKAVGLSRHTLEKVQEVVAAAAADPEQFGPLKAEMDRTGKVSKPHAKLNKLKNKDVGAPSPVDESPAGYNQEIASFAEKSFIALSGLHAKGAGNPLSQIARKKLQGLLDLISGILGTEEVGNE